jgi:Ser/Thr protein kinase RdoA (MazF antagonist)
MPRATTLLQSNLNRFGLNIESEVGSSWHRRRQYRCHDADGRNFFLKQWSMPADRDAIWSETDTMARLDRIKSSISARQFRFAGETSLAIDARSTLTACEFLSGPTLEEAFSVDSLSAALGALNELHETSWIANPPASSCARELCADLAPRVSPSSDVGVAVQFLSERAEALSKLPTALIHGDFNLSNVVVCDTGTKLVDFEFARLDIRILDLAALFAPRRLSTRGALERIEGIGDDTILGLAAERLNPSLSSQECDLYPAAVFFHLLRVLRDVTVSSDANSALVLPALGLAVAQYIDT